MRLLERARARGPERRPVSASPGLTLIELLLALTLMSIVVAAVVELPRVSHDTWSLAARRSELQSNARLGIEWLTRDLRQATAIVAISGSGTSDGYVRYLDAGGVEHRYDRRLDAAIGGPVLARDGQAVIEVVTGLECVGLGVDLVTETAIPDSIQAVRITMTVADRDGQSEPLPVSSVIRRRVDVDPGGGLCRRRVCELTIRGSLVPKRLTDLPVLVTEACLPDELLDGDGDAPARDGGGDLLFTADGGGAERLACEVVTCRIRTNPTLSDVEVWVRVPELKAGKDTSIWVWYHAGEVEQPAAGDEFGAEAVWNDDYLLVMHLDEDPDGPPPQFRDASGSGHHGTQGGGLTGADRIDGPIGLGIRFAGGPGDHIDLGVWDVPGRELTIQHWVLRAAGSTVDGAFYSRAAGEAVGEHLMTTDFGADGGTFPRVRLTTTKGSVSLTADDPQPADTWTFFAATLGSNKLDIWVNDGAVAETAEQGQLRGSDTLHHLLGDRTGGGAELSGCLDEVRVSKVCRDEAWLYVEYLNQSDPARFVLPGEPRPAPAGGGCTTVTD